MFPDFGCRRIGRSAGIDYLGSHFLQACQDFVRQAANFHAVGLELLDQPVRDRVRTTYALVRIADEIVDGAAENAGAQYAAGEDPYKKPADGEQ